MVQLYVTIECNNFTMNVEEEGPISGNTTVETLKKMFPVQVKFEKCKNNAEAILYIIALHGPLLGFFSRRSFLVTFFLKSVKSKSGQLIKDLKGLF